MMGHIYWGFFLLALEQAAEILIVPLQKEK